MFAARAATSTLTKVVARQGATTFQRRNAQTIPRLASEADMKSEALAQLRARIARQKEIEKGTHISHDAEVKEMWKWIKISFMVAIPVCVLSVIKDVVAGHEHHDDSKPVPDYMNIRTKAFPWECEDCALFDGKCWEKCRAEKEAAV
mmetsp:Transcript_4506/g.4273  ORF Transcript_4506/g.4273 Transcript_4506/m.4273 type:complete len:147 (-) Transcript_4506:275-715(-)|eukprot:CAMPEP_0197831474 /NCGR_PEP_ID=MMETSP1437-20131217/10208_1 /TAXON_ID=49252 ORGANISM="Eucampia antarctica, Strain CCMP1452" /NCGR_SAMPLE_ID=MMETSP1437 /ASSEMBLY_ACC=CAM_ASM_001096 /LENGTH=146 /DNA_ID=CAMNT_0043434397 /DNA_START=60 /DNA_END=500 /DNA_ORIENTATION=+